MSADARMTDTCERSRYIGPHAVRTDSRASGKGSTGRRLRAGKKGAHEAFQGHTLSGSRSPASIDPVHRCGKATTTLASFDSFLARFHLRREGGFDDASRATDRAVARRRGRGSDLDLASRRWSQSRHVTSLSKWPSQCVVGCRSVMSGHALVDYASLVVCCRISATADPRSLRFTSIGP